MPKVLLITSEFPPFAGGVGNYYFNLAKKLPESDIAIVTEKLPDSDSADLNNLKVFKRKLLTPLPIWPRWIFAVIKIARLKIKTRSKALWVGQILPWGTVCFIYKKLFGWPYFVSLHGTDLLSAQATNLKKFLALKILKNADFITVNSKFTQYKLSELGNFSKNSTVIYPAPNIKPTTDYQPTYNNTKIILSVSRLVPRKGLLNLIKAMPGVINKNPEAKLYIIGNGPQNKELTDKINSLGLTNNIIIENEITNDQLRNFYQKCDLFVLTPQSINNEIEGLGIVYQEAELFGKPVIASAEGGITETVIDGQTGLIINNPENTQELSNLINKLLADPGLRKRLGQNAQKFIKEKFNWQNQADSLSKLINNFYG